MIYWNKLPFE